MRYFFIAVFFLASFNASAQVRESQQADSVQPGQIVINEFLAMNTTVIDDFYGEFDDWVELYNNTANSISLDNVYLSDSYNNRMKWQFPLGTTIGPNAYLIVWTDGDSLQVNGFHTPFKLSGTGEKVMLSYADGFIIDSVRYGQQVEDISWGRYPNGTGPYMALNPTFAGPNSPLSVNENFAAPFYLFPNPVQDVLNLDLPNPENFTAVEIINLEGQVLLSVSPCIRSQIDMSVYPAGAYFIRLTGAKSAALGRFIKL